MCGSSLAVLCLVSCLSIIAFSPAHAQCSDMDGDGYGIPATGCAHTEEDCNDHDANAFPGNPVEVCDGFDNDCDYLIDEDASCSGLLSAIIKGEQRAVSKLENWAHYPAMAWNGESYGVFWDEAYSKKGYFTVVDINGNRLGPEKPLFDGSFDINYPNMVFTGRHYGLVWIDERSPEYQVYFAILDRHGERVIEDMPVATVDNFVSNPRVVWNGNSYGVFWLDDRAVSGGRRTYFRPISADGVLGTEVFLDIGNNNPPGHEFGTDKLSAIWGEGYYGLAVQKIDLTDTRIYRYFVRLDRGGVEQSRTLIEGNSSPNNINVWLTWNGEQYGYWWNRDTQVLFTPLWADGSFVNPSGSEHVQVTSGIFPNYLSRAAWNGEEYGLLYRPQISFPSTDNQLRFQRVNETGGLEGTEIQVSTASVDSRVNASLVWNGEDFGIVWTDNINGNQQIFFNDLGNDFDVDGRAGRRDCDDDNDQLWSVPGEATDLTLDGDTLDWLAPQDTGGSGLTITYDVLRSENAADFSSATCVESGISGLSATDTSEPVPGVAYKYLVRANNACGNGHLGIGLTYTPRSAGSCP